MNEKEQLIKEIEQAPDLLVKEVLNFLLSAKNRAKENTRAKNADWDTQLKKMAQDREIQAEIKDIDREFSITEIDGLT
ncbi:MAG: hypothetical protein QNJ72_25980 [Pleurocapsa sp. MO_226.B13]|nr:hypothetical protein [Pleurocapsa sp. MO_226.B13]